MPFLERHEVPLLLGAVAAGVMAGLLAPQAAALLQRLAPQFDLGLTMVPLMMLVLAAVALSQTPRALGAGSSLLLLVPLYAVFAVLAATAGMLLARLLRLEARAVSLSGATRNSLVVLPLAPAAVVTQTLVELVVLVVLVRVLRR